MTQERLVVGVDGGSSKTIALIATTSGEVVGFARGPGCNLYIGAPQAHFELVAATVASAATAAGAKPSDLAGGAFSVAGADCEADTDYLRGCLADLGVAGEVRVVNDAVGALYAGCPQGNGVTAVCGTWFAIGSRSQSGSVWYGGHWADWGSGPRGALGGRPMADAAIRAVVSDALGLGPATELTASLLAAFSADDVGEMIHELSLLRREAEGEAPKANITQLLLRASDDGDTVARELVTGFGTAIGDLVVVAARGAGIDREPFDLALMGGVLREDCSTLREALLDSVRRKVSEEPHVVTPVLEPAHGAVLIALEALQLDPGSVRCALARTSPSPELFATTGGAALAKHP